MKVLTTVPCSGNAAGLKGKGYAIPASEISTWPAYKTTTSAGDTVTLNGAPTLVSTSGIGYFREFPILLEKGSYSITAVGGLGSKSFEERMVYVVAGVDAAQLEYVKNILNIPGVWLAPDKNDVIHVLGSKDDPAYVEAVEGTTGTAGTDERIITITVRVLTKSPTVWDSTAVIDVTPNA